MLGAQHDFKRDSDRSFAVRFRADLISGREHAPCFARAARGKDFGEPFAAILDGALLHHSTSKWLMRCQGMNIILYASPPTSLIVWMKSQTFPETLISIIVKLSCFKMHQTFRFGSSPLIVPPASIRDSARSSTARTRL